MRSDAKRVVYLYCHPLADSFHAAIRAEASRGLAEGGHAVELIDLYAEGFDPALSGRERRLYYDPARNRAGLDDIVSRLEAAQVLIVQFPTWCFGPPAMIKGFADRVLIPGVAFDIADGRLKPRLGRIERIVGIVTYGQTRWVTLLASDHSRHFVTRHLRWIASPKARTDYLALYDMDHASAATREAFLNRVRRRMTRLSSR